MKIIISTLLESIHRGLPAFSIAAILTCVGCHDHNRDEPLPTLSINVVSELQNTVTGSYMIDQGGHKIVIGYLKPDSHAYTLSRFSFPITKHWTFHWTDGEKQKSGEFEIDEDLLAEDPIPVQVTIHEDGIVRATRYGG